MVFQIFAKPRAKPCRKDEPTESKSRTEFIVKVLSGKWAGPHQVELLSRQRVPESQRQDGQSTAAQELEQLQGEWEVIQCPQKGEREDGYSRPHVKIYVRGKRVEEHTADTRMFFNLVLADKALGPEAGVGGVRLGKGKAALPKRHELPPRSGPKWLPEGVDTGMKLAKGKAGKLGTAKGKGGKGGKGSKGQREKASPAAGHWILLHHTPKLLVHSGVAAVSQPIWWHPSECSVWARGGPALETCRIRYSDNHTEELLRHSDDPTGIWRTKKGVQVQLQLCPRA